MHADAGARHDKPWLAAGTLFLGLRHLPTGSVAQDAARYNAQMAEYAFQDAERRGEEGTLAVRRKAAWRSSRVSVWISPLAVRTSATARRKRPQDQTDFFGEQDVATGT